MADDEGEGEGKGEVESVELKMLSFFQMAIK